MSEHAVVTIGFGPTSWQAASAARKEVAIAISAELDEMCAELGLHGGFTVQSTRLSDAGLTLTIGAISRSFPSVAALRLLDPLRTRQPGPDDVDRDLALVERPLEPEDIPNAVATACRMMVVARPDALWTVEEARAWSAEPIVADASAPADVACHALAECLRLGLSLGDRSRVGTVLGDTEGVVAEELGERLIDALAPRSIDVLAEPAFLRRLTTDAHCPEMLASLRGVLLDEFGLPVPALRLVPDPSLPGKGFAFRIGGLRTEVQIGLNDTEILVVDASLEELGRWGVPAVAGRNPFTGDAAAVVSRALRASMEADGHMVLESSTHVAATLAERVRRAVPALVHRKVIEDMLTFYEQGYPEVTIAARSHLSVGAIAAVLRDLLADRLPVRNLSQILELLLEHAEGRPGSGIDFVRAGLADQIALRVSRGSGVVSAYLLSEAVERAVEDAAVADPGAGIWLSSLVRKEMGSGIPAAVAPVVLTSPSMRAAIRDLLSAEFPGLTVIAYTDLPSDTLVRPLARLG